MQQSILTPSIGLAVHVIVILFANTKTCAASFNVTGTCSSKCTIDGPNELGCFNETRDFFQSVLVNEMRQYIIVQVHRAKWALNSNHHFNFGSQAEDSIDRIAAIEPPRIEDENGILRPSDFAPIIEVLMARAEEIFEDETATEQLPSVECPLGCEVAWEPDFWLFIVSAFVNVVLFTVIMVCVVILDHLDRMEVKKELEECETMYMQRNNTARTTQRSTIVPVTTKTAPVPVQAPVPPGVPEKR